MNIIDVYNQPGTLEAAIERSNPGDMVRLRQNYDFDVSLTGRHRGAHRNPIIIDGGGAAITGRIVWDGPAAHLQFSNGETIGRPEVGWAGFRVRRGGHHVALRDWKIRDCGGPGFSAENMGDDREGWAWIHLDGVTVDNCCTNNPYSASAINLFRPHAAPGPYGQDDGRTAIVFICNTIVTNTPEGNQLNPTDGNGLIIDDCNALGDNAITIIDSYFGHNYGRGIHHLNTWVPRLNILDVTLDQNLKGFEKGTHNAALSFCSADNAYIDNVFVNQPGNFHAVSVQDQCNYAPRESTDMAFIDSNRFFGKVRSESDTVRPVKVFPYPGSARTIDGRVHHITSGYQPFGNDTGTPAPPPVVDTCGLEDVAGIVDRHGAGAVIRAVADSL